MATIIAALTVRTLSRNADYQDPVRVWEGAIDVAPHNPRAHANLGRALKVQGRLDEAARCYRQALRLLPDQTLWLKRDQELAAIAKSNLGLLLVAQGKLDLAMEHYEEALNLEPDMVNPLFGIAWILATHPDPERRDASKAVELAERAMGLTELPRSWHFDKLAATYAAKGRFGQAQAVAEKALVLASEENNNQLANDISERLELYKQAKPYRESLQTQGSSISDPKDAQD